MEFISLDAIDLQLLNLLQTDAAQSNQALAEQVHVSPPTCLRRVKRLHSREVPRLLGRPAAPEVIHRDNMVVIAG